MSSLVTNYKVLKATYHQGLMLLLKVLHISEIFTCIIIKQLIFVLPTSQRKEILNLSFLFLKAKMYVTHNIILLLY